MQTTIKRIDADGLASGPICPMNLQPCMCSRCAIYSDDWQRCGLGPAALYNAVRDAVTDAAVDVRRAYGRENA